MGAHVCTHVRVCTCVRMVEVVHRQELLEGLVERGSTAGADGDSGGHGSQVRGRPLRQLQRSLRLLLDCAVSKVPCTEEI